MKMHWLVPYLIIFAVVETAVLVFAYYSLSP